LNGAAVVLFAANGRSYKLHKPQQPGGIYSLEGCDHNHAFAFMYLFKEKDSD
jgi:hypothetical protein